MPDSPGFCEAGSVITKATCREGNLQNEDVLGMSHLKRILLRRSLKNGFEERAGHMKSLLVFCDFLKSPSIEFLLTVLK